MSIFKNILTATLIISMIFMTSSFTISALTDIPVEQEVILSQDIPDEDALPCSDELLSAYLEKEIYPVSTFGRSAYDLLNENEKQIYNVLKQKILSVAAGSTTSTTFEITSALDAFSWTAADLGVSQLTSGNSLTQAAQVAVSTKIQSVINTGDIMRALTSDLPCELFWFDKTDGMSTSYATSAQSSKVWVSRLVFTFFVSPDFQGTTNKYTNLTKISQINTAKQTAQSIVAKHASKSDFDKLTAYKDEICDLTDYYSGNLNVSYGNPWQLVWVFDNDPSTDVVCEGYSKAFKYLCDLSEFSSDVYCYLVTGTMTTSTMSGPHMWNLIEIYGKNYLVDLTNSDDGSIGDDGSLFMVGASEQNNGAAYQVGTMALYSYDTDNIGNYLEDGVFLPVSSMSYAYDTNRIFNVTVTGGEGSGSYATGGTVTITATPNSNQEFEYWELTSGGISLNSIFSETTSFTMPARDVTIRAVYHTHIISERMHFDEYEHWYEYECGCVERIQIGEHAYNYTVPVEPTCTEKGIENFTCIECGFSYEQELDVLLHEYDDGVITKQPTTDSEGLKKFTCTACGDSYLDIVEKLPPSADDNESDKKDDEVENTELVDDSKNKLENDLENWLENDQPGVLVPLPDILGGCGASVSTAAVAIVCTLGAAILTKRKKK